MYVYQRRVTVVLGLTTGYELPEVPSGLHGRVVGLPSTPTGQVFAGCLASILERIHRVSDRTRRKFLVRRGSVSGTFYCS